MRTIKKAFAILGHAAKLSLMPSLTAGALLVTGTIAITQYSEFSEYISTFWRMSYFLEPELLMHTASWLLKVISFGFIFSMLVLLHARNQEVALAKLREIDDA